MEDEPNVLPLTDDEDEEPITAQTVLRNLENAWLNERAAPEILPHQTEMVDLILDQINHIEENVNKLDKNDFRVITHRMELERIKFIVSSYLRCRLQKIETFHSHILAEEEYRSEEAKLLNENELKFCQEYANNIDDLFNKLVFAEIPSVLKKDDHKERVVKPNLMSHVFFKANTTIPAVVIEGPNEEDVNIKPGSQHIMPYRFVSDLVLDGKIQLF